MMRTKTIRHLERMVNTLKFDATTLKNEVDYADLTGVLALRATNPDAYRFVRDNRIYLIDSVESHIDKDRSRKQAKDALERFIGVYMPPGVPGPYIPPV